MALIPAWCLGRRACSTPLVAPGTKPTSLAASAHEFPNRGAGRLEGARLDLPGDTSPAVGCPVPGQVRAEVGLRLDQVERTRVGGFELMGGAAIWRFRRKTA